MCILLISFLGLLLYLKSYVIMILDVLIFAFNITMTRKSAKNALDLNKYVQEGHKASY